MTSDSNSHQVVDLTGIAIWDMDEKNRIPLSGTFSCDQLLKLLTREWIPYTECTQCGKGDYCKFHGDPIFDPRDTGNIKCGVTVTALENFLKCTFPEFVALRPEEKQHYIDAAFRFVQFIDHAEQVIGNYIDLDILNHWECIGPKRFSTIVHLRNHLNRMAEHLECIPNFQSHAFALLVEGESELAFLEVLRRNRAFGFIDLHIESARGKDRMRPARIEQLLEKYREEGFRVGLQGDLDGRKSTKFDNLVEKKLVRKKDIFLFEWDFETSIPHPLLYSGLRLSGMIEDVDLETFVQKASLRRNEKNILDHLKMEFPDKLRLGSKKTLAFSIGKVLTHRQTPVDWERILQGSELLLFYEFVRDLHFD